MQVTHEIYTWKTPSVWRIKTTGLVGVHPSSSLIMKIEGKDTQISLQGCHTPPTTTYIRANTKEKRNWEISPKNAGYTSCNNRRSRALIDDLNHQDVVLYVVNQLWKFQNDPTVGSPENWNFVKAVQKICTQTLSQKSASLSLSHTLSIFSFLHVKNPRRKQQLPKTSRRSQQSPKHMGHTSISDWAFT